MLKRLFPCLAFMLFSMLTSAFASTGTVVKNTIQWDGLTRNYAVYVPKGLPSNAPMVVFLHATMMGNPRVPPYLALSWDWEPQADQQKFLLVYPVSTYNTRSSQWYWNCDFFDFSFSNPPDDVGFIRSVITTVQAKYHTNPRRVFVSGMSSGAFMVHRVGIELSDIVAAIAPVSGTLWAQPDGQVKTPPLPTNPISVLEYHGTHDQEVLYCGGTDREMWKEPDNTVASTQADISYWVSANSCSKLSTTQKTCIGNRANPNFINLDATGCLNNVEVKFIPEVGTAHVWLPGTAKAVWTFFATHGR